MFYISVCNAGLYKNGNDCEICSGNTIKPKTGDAISCNTDTPCDGVTKVPDVSHTNCGLCSPISISKQNVMKIIWSFNLKF